MTDRQERFLREYLVDRNADAAARRAGYSARYGRKLAALPEVQAAAEKAAAKREAQCAVRREQVLQGLCELAFSEEGGSGRLKALELLGRHLGLFEGRTEKVQPVTVVEDV